MPADTRFSPVKQSGLQRVCPEPVITDVVEAMYGKSVVTNGKTPCFQFRYLVGD